MMYDQLPVVLTGLFQTQDQDEKLLQPVRDLHQVVSFHGGEHVPMGIAYRTDISAQCVRSMNADAYRAKSVLCGTTT